MQPDAWLQGRWAVGWWGGVRWGWGWGWEQIIPYVALSLLLASLLLAKHFSQAFRVAFVLFFFFYL